MCSHSAVMSLFFLVCFRFLLRCNRLGASQWSMWRRSLLPRRSGNGHTVQLCLSWRLLLPIRISWAYNVSPRWVGQCLCCSSWRPLVWFSWGWFCFVGPLVLAGSSHHVFCSKVFQCFCKWFKNLLVRPLFPWCWPWLLRSCQNNHGVMPVHWWLVSGFCD